MNGLQKRAFYNEVGLGLCQFLLAVVYHYHTKGDDLDDPNIYPNGLINAERTKRILPYIYAA